MMISKFGSVKVVKKIKQLSLEEGLSFLQSTESSKDIPHLYRAKDRLETFYKTGFSCVKCGVSASHFSIEQIESSSFDGVTINLYGESDGKLIFFTKDHIIPKSKGGPDSVENYQTMCWDCNRIKGNNMT